MPIQELTKDKEYELQVGYGIGASCQAVLKSSEVEGQPTRHLIDRVARSAQSTEPARRTARVLREVLASDRVVNIELSAGPGSNQSTGNAIDIDEVVVPPNGESETVERQRVTLHLSEDYKGGRPCKES